MLTIIVSKNEVKGSICYKPISRSLLFKGGTLPKIFSSPNWCTVVYISILFTILMYIVKNFALGCTSLAYIVAHNGHDCGFQFWEHKGNDCGFKYLQLAS